MRGVTKICDEPEPPNEGACLRCVMNLDRQTGLAQWGERGVFKICDEGGFKIYDDEPEAPQEGACVFEPESHKGGRGACLRYVMNRSCHMRGVFKI